MCLAVFLLSQTSSNMSSYISTFDQGILMKAGYPNGRFHSCYFLTEVALFFIGCLNEENIIIENLLGLKRFALSSH